MITVERSDIRGNITDKSELVCKDIPKNDVIVVVCELRRAKKTLGKIEIIAVPKYNRYDIVIQNAHLLEDSEASKPLLELYRRGELEKLFEVMRALAKP